MRKVEENGRRYKKAKLSFKLVLQGRIWDSVDNSVYIGKNISKHLIALRPSIRGF